MYKLLLNSSPANGARSVERGWCHMGRGTKIFVFYDSQARSLLSEELWTGDLTSPCYISPH